MHSQTKKSKEELNLKEIVLSDDSNIILPEVSFPSNYKAQGEVKYGAKSNEHKLASQHELLEYQRRVSRKDSTLTSEEIRSLVSETNARRLALQSMNRSKHLNRNVYLNQRLDVLKNERSSVNLGWHMRMTISVELG